MCDLSQKIHLQINIFSFPSHHSTEKKTQPSSSGQLFRFHMSQTPCPNSQAMEGTNLSVHSNMRQLSVVCDNPGA